jgi:hypothetical protein
VDAVDVCLGVEALVCSLLPALFRLSSWKLDVSSHGHFSSLIFGEVERSGCSEMAVLEDPGSNADEFAFGG